MRYRKLISLIGVLAGIAVHSICTAQDAPTGSQSGTGGQVQQGRMCWTKSMCPQPGAPCQKCDDGSLVCPSADCVDNRCVIKFPKCPAPFDPCADKECGDTCRVCNPADPECIENDLVKFCQPDGTCAAPKPECAPKDPCSSVKCPAGTQCITEGDPPHAVCKDTDTVECGGLLGLQCPGFGKCVDDPADDCDPADGGSDCIGMCICRQPLHCPQGEHFDASPGVCRCVKGVRCGDTTCDAGDICCSPSCGICGPRGGFCPQIACGITP